MQDQYLIDIKFAEELFNFLHLKGFLLFGFESSWYPKLPILELRDQMDVSVFHEEIGWSLLHIIRYYIEEIEDCHEDFLRDMGILAHTKDIKDIDYAYFKRCALKVAPLFFSNGYSHGSFLGYCALVLGVAYNFLLQKPNPVPRSACEVIGLVLFIHQMTGEFHKEGGWKGLGDASFDFNQIMEMNSIRSRKESIRTRRNIVLIPRLNLKVKQYSFQFNERYF